MPRYLADLRSDFSAIHGVRDINTLSADEFFEMAWRMSAYRGVMRMRIEAEHTPSRSDAPGASPEPNGQTLTVDQLMLSTPGLIERAAG